MHFFGRAVGWGIAIYAIMYLVWSGLVIYGLSSSIESLGVRILALVLITAIAARSLHAVTRLDVVPYSVGWALVAIVLDAIFLVPFAGFALFAQWSIWAGYALIVLAPLVTFKLPHLGGSMRVEARKMPAGL